MGTYRKTKGIQSYPRIWGCYDPIESSPSETKKGGLYGGSVKKSDFRAIFGQKQAVAPPQEHAQQHEEHENVVFLVSRHDGNNKIGGFAQKNDFGPKTALLGPKRPTLDNRGHETARRAAKRPPTGKPKLSRVTSGYGGLMISFGRVRLTQKNGGYIDVA